MKISKIILFIININEFIKYSYYSIFFLVNNVHHNDVCLQNNNIDYSINFYTSNPLNNV